MERLGKLNRLVQKLETELQDRHCPNCRRKAVIVHHGYGDELVCQDDECGWESGDIINRDQNDS